MNSMEGISVTFQRIEERTVNYVSVMIRTESGCNIQEGEYSMSIDNIMGSLDISTHNIEVGVDDVSLIKDAIENEFDFSKLPDEGMTEIILKESGEWEDVFWNKFYEIERFCIINQ